MKIRILLGLMMLFISSLVFAKDVYLYDQPVAGATVIGTIDTSTGLIPIFNRSGWLKAADPRNGKIGWLQMGDLMGLGVPTNSSINIKLETDQKPQTYPLMQFGKVPLGTSPAMQNLQNQTQKMQQDLSNSVTGVVNSMQQIFQWNTGNPQNAPMFAPAQPTAQPTPAVNPSVPQQPVAQPSGVNQTNTTHP